MRWSWNLGVGGQKNARGMLAFPVTESNPCSVHWFHDTYRNELVTIISMVLPLCQPTMVDHCVPSCRPCSTIADLMDYASNDQQTSYERKVGHLGVRCWRKGLGFGLKKFCLVCVFDVIDGQCCQRLFGFVHSFVDNVVLGPG